MTDTNEQTNLINKGDQAEKPKQTALEIFLEEVVHLRWRVLIITCFLTFGGYYIYDFPGSIGTGRHDSIESRFEDHGKSYTQEMNQALYSVYSWPNTVLAFFGGILIDNVLGLRKAMLLFVTLVTLGSIIFWIGVWTVQYPVLLVGRLVFGFGNESLSVSQSAFVARWFNASRGMALAFGITISFSRVGSSFNFLFSPMIAEKLNVQTASLVGFFCCLVSLLSCFGLIAFDIYGARKGLVPPETKETNAPFKIADVKKMPPRFWLISLICVSVYCSIFPFIGIAKNYFEVKYDVSGTEASTYVSFYQFACAGGSPVLGAIVDTIGRFTFWMIAASSGFTLFHLIMIFTSANAIGMMIYMGFVYSILVSALWPSIPYVVSQGSVGLAYGIMTSMQNTGLAIYPLITGGILNGYTPAKYDFVHNTSCYNYTHTNSNVSIYPMGTLIGCPNRTGSPLPTLEGFKWTEVVFIITAALGVLATVTLCVTDLRGTKILSSNPTIRKELKKQAGLDVPAIKDEKDILNISNADGSQAHIYDDAVNSV